MINEKINLSFTVKPRYHAIPSYIKSIQWFPFILLLVTALPYLFFIHRLGFYLDDWQVLFLEKSKSWLSFWNYFFYDRPFSIWTYLIALPVLQLNPLLWQIYALVLRWLSGLGLYWTLNSIWPEQKWQTKWIAVLFVVFPGFSQQLISIAYSQHFITYALFTFSLGCMVASINHPRFYWLFAPLAWLTCFAQLLTMEYFSTLELLRPLILLILILRSGQRWAKTLGQIFLHWLPFLLILFIFSWWRFVLYPTLLPAADPNAAGLFNHGTEGFVDFINISLRDALRISLFSWFNLFTPENIDIHLKEFN